ncbi:dihydrodipicolinate synthase family protein [Cohaesibacter sp. CAU 1516]|uniref:dihydrodipicolinate synthase family protein n=1 Tax=Cohaesibacter sp. CAU 1516 TaxID=2576038 RepID=UPI0010FDE72F|nr:dihydrodipicolinate synthase family protein [Cohaesibacter sp. CAU 1516]TLP42344.1 dihydrodipicolinate synthase family protein [Cohaesibacter sp. CAU 1516]
MTNQPLRGIFAAVLTPILENGTLDLASLSAHAKGLLERGCHGVSLFGTTGEGPGFTTEERMQGLEAALSAGISADKILPATGCVALPDTIKLTKHALEHGCNNILLMPPFFFKSLTDDQVFAFFSKVITEVNDPALQVYLYNFPAVTGVLISPNVIARLVEAFPTTIAGVKDSSGEWDYMMEIRNRCPDIAVFTGWEALVPKLLAAGGAGNISGVANVAPELLRDLFDRVPVATDDKVLNGVEHIVAAVTSSPVTPALKAILADQTQQAEWEAIRVPNLPIDDEEKKKLLSAFAHGKSMAGF